MSVGYSRDSSSFPQDDDSVTNSRHLGRAACWGQFGLELRLEAGRDLDSILFSDAGSREHPCCSTCSHTVPGFSGQHPKTCSSLEPGASEGKPEGPKAPKARLGWIFA